MLILTVQIFHVQVLRVLILVVLALLNQIYVALIFVQKESKKRFFWALRIMMLLSGQVGFDQRIMVRLKCLNES
ncbi:hypothetical protein TX23_11835 [Pseudomonas paralactis]|uniref:Uncharacterized protein n=1 Tax=Pseudomonas paralactis TaxID=1615673 RepID=A0A0R3AGD2_9PSED|nr:hypothetical protein TX23_11835 [Pseudomonas paralactis]